MNTKRLVMLNVIILIILVGGGFAAFSYYNRTVNYLSTDNVTAAGKQLGTLMIYGQTMKQATIDGINDSFSVQLELHLLL